VDLVSLHPNKLKEIDMTLIKLFFLNHFSIANNNYVSVVICVISLSRPLFVGVSCRFHGYEYLSRLVCRYLSIGSVFSHCSGSPYTVTMLQCPLGFTSHASAGLQNVLFCTVTLKLQLIPLFEIPPPTQIGVDGRGTV
jgi:hypothetical protein